MASKGGRLKKKTAGHPPDCQCGPCCFKRKSDGEFAKKVGLNRKPSSIISALSLAGVKKPKRRRQAKSIFAPGVTPQPAKKNHASTPLQTAGAAGSSATAATNSGSQKPLRWRKAMPLIVTGCKNQ